MRDLFSRGSRKDANSDTSSYQQGAYNSQQSEMMAGGAFLNFTYHDVDLAKDLGFLCPSI